MSRVQNCRFFAGSLGCYSPWFILWKQTDQTKGMTIWRKPVRLSLDRLVLLMIILWYQLLVWLGYIYSIIFQLFLINPVLGVAWFWSYIRTRCTPTKGCNVWSKSEVLCAFTRLIGGFRSNQVRKVWFLPRRPVHQSVHGKDPKPHIATGCWGWRQCKVVEQSVCNGGKVS